jgi:hypothetical protein
MSGAPVKRQALSLREANERGEGEEKIQLPALRCGARREQEQDL